MGNNYHLSADGDMSALEMYLGVVIMKEGAKAEAVRIYHSGIMLNEKINCCLKGRESKISIGKNDLRG